ncbi:hypothetical protein METBIDRAFT_15072, partial [Metschnikowia bicuspidata var. bicuspidata NRRL YB-4993]
KTPLKKEELEKIAQELKKKLSRASVAAKQLLSATATGAGRSLLPDSPVLQTLLPKLSPLKNYYMWRRQIAGATAKNVTLLPVLYSPGRRLPTLTKPSIFLSSSPLKNFNAGLSPAEPSPAGALSRKASMDSEALTELNDSPPHMVLEEIHGPQTPPKREALHPLPVLSSNPPSGRRTGPKPALTTPTLAKKPLSTGPNALLKTPTQAARGDAYNDDEGADLLMYLAASPSVPKSGAANTPRAPHNVAFAGHPGASKPHSGSLFMAPPLTPKRPLISTAKTPQNRLTPSVYGGLAVPGSTLPSAGLALTPAGFNMNDYVNFFTPSPGTAAAAHGGLAGRTLLKTPDFHGQVQSAHTSVDGKMINFDKAELF